MCHIVTRTPLLIRTLDDWKQSGYHGTETILKHFAQKIHDVVQYLVCPAQRQQICAEFNNTFRDEFHRMQDPKDIFLKSLTDFQNLTADQASEVNNLGFDLSHAQNRLLVLRADEVRKIVHAYLDPICGLPIKQLEKVEVKSPKSGFKSQKSDKPHGTVKVYIVGGMAQQNYLQKLILETMPPFVRQENVHFPAHRKGLVASGALLYALDHNVVSGSMPVDRPMVAVVHNHRMDSRKNIPKQLEHHLKLRQEPAGTAVVSGLAKALWHDPGGRGADRLDCVCVRIQRNAKGQFYVPVVPCWVLQETLGGKLAPGGHNYLLKHPEARVRYLGQMAIQIEASSMALLQAQGRPSDDVEFLIGTTWKDDKLVCTVRIPAVGHFHEQFRKHFPCDVYPEDTCGAECYHSNQTLHQQYGLVKTEIDLTEHFRAEQMGDEIDSVEKCTFSHWFPQEMYDLPGQGPRVPRPQEETVEDVTRDLLVLAGDTDDPKPAGNSGDSKPTVGDVAQEFGAMDLDQKQDLAEDQGHEEVEDSDEDGYFDEEGQEMDVDPY